ncbi:hypothetical protein [Spirosoma sp.]|uniref:hypothetical protein n=1 Tax=Spirosoma sp. TaxID=1899569 RepID=UPI00262AF9FA|nr:hypothetical protein [Spirosoma sp.]MCX6212809.1 hypothetical protein [Spirosoma sp.]
MDAEQQMDMQSGYVEHEQYERLVSDLIDRINVASEEVSLSKLDKLTISFGLKLLRFELAKEADLMQE